MRIIATNTLLEFIKRYPKCEQQIKAWLQEVQKAQWTSPQHLKDQFQSASIITGKRVVFNISGNNFRLIIDIEYRLQIIFIVWFGTHKEYDLIDAKTVKYAKANKDK